MLFIKKIKNLDGDKERWEDLDVALKAFNDMDIQYLLHYKLSFLQVGANYKSLFIKIPKFIRW